MPLRPPFAPLLFVLLLSLLLPGRALLAGPGRLPVPGQEQPVALLTGGRATYLVTEHGVFRRQGRRFVVRYQSPTPILCALATDTTLWLGTADGMRALALRSGLVSAVPLPGPAAQAPVTALCREAGGAVWAAATGYGAYRRDSAGWVAQLSIPTINAGATTADSALWLGTNLGLYRWQRGQWTRYNEEGVANHEIPDNLVERLLLDNEANLWVFMSEGISVFESRRGSEAGELPTVRFIGQPGNAVYSVAHLPGQGYAFATARGLLLLPDQAQGPLPAAPTTDRVETPRVLRPLALPAQPAPRLLRIDDRGRIWVASAGVVSIWGPGAFRRATQSAASTELSALN